jgi:hypothetical protein
MKHTTRPKAGAGRGSALLLCLSASASASANERSIWISPPSMPVIFSMMRASNQRQRFNRTVTNASSARARHTFIHSFITNPVLASHCGCVARLLCLWIWCNLKEAASCMPFVTILCMYVCGPSVNSGPSSCGKMHSGHWTLVHVRRRFDTLIDFFPPPPSFRGSFNLFSYLICFHLNLAFRFVRTWGDYFHFFVCIIIVISNHRQVTGA